MTIKPLNILGLMSGTSLDGIKASVVSTDGIDIYETIFTKRFAFDENLRFKIRTILGKKSTIEEDRLLINTVEEDLTKFLCSIIEEIKMKASNLWFINMAEY